MPQTITRLPVSETESASDPAAVFAANLVAADPDTAAAITKALLESLDAGVAAILRASSP